MIKVPLQLTWVPGHGKISQGQNAILDSSCHEWQMHVAASLQHSHISMHTRAGQLAIIQPAFKCTQC